MRLVISLIIIVYLIGVGVVLAPIIQSQWNTAPASELTGNLARALPDALTWPAKIYRSFQPGTQAANP